ncbi:hypothetical protein L6452_28835 [Arctium lappa]|uniref:Uncharacterized protein n=1 Tax=Arctium lappa TaxID=4217 RepID=A0ACB9A0D7_ARCLA|nr:hypothetical protein L6452_28835 [Arctium lappa]
MPPMVSESCLGSTQTSFKWIEDDEKDQNHRLVAGNFNSTVQRRCADSSLSNFPGCKTPFSFFVKKDLIFLWTCLPS